MAKKRKTSDSVASIASEILKDGRFGEKSKTVAGSALSQKHTGKKK